MEKQLNFDFTIIIATFNSMKTLPLVLNAIQNQDYDLSKIQVLLVDGHSKDDTRNIHKKYTFCSLINNDNIDPVSAKYIGYKNAQGKYLMYLDHDEVLDNPQSLKQKFEIFESDSQIAGISTSGYNNPSNYSFLNQYINDFGDPFSAYYYNLTKDSRFFVKTMKAKYSPDFNESEKFISFRFDQNVDLPLIELVAGGACIRKSFIDSANYTPNDLPLLFKQIVYSGLKWGISKNDSITHYSAESFANYKNKIKWRIRNNIFHSNEIGQSGFSGREKNSLKNKIKKMLFIPYSVLLLPSLIHSFIFMIKQKSYNYIIHCPLSLYTGLWICIYMTFRLLGISTVSRTYDGQKLSKPKIRT